MSTNKAALYRFIRSTVQEIRRGAKLQLLVDFDGTIAPLSDDPLHARANPEAARALYRLARHPAVSVTFVTGRSVEDLRQRLKKAHMVLPFNIIGSYGAEVQRAGKRVVVQEQLPPGSATVMDEFNRAAMDLKSRHPGLITQKKHGSVNVDVRSMDDTDQAHRMAVISEARQAFAMISSHPDMPMVDGAPLFQIQQESSHEICIRTEVFDKAYAIKKARFIDPYEITIFMGDSFTSHGGDRSAAVLVNDKTQFFNGHVVQVMNGRDGPVDPKAPEAPSYVLEDTAETGKFLNRMALNFDARNPFGRTFRP